jgi:hypothetical protein
LGEENRGKEEQKNNICLNNANNGKVQYQYMVLYDGYQRREHDHLFNKHIYPL